MAERYQEFNNLAQRVGTKIAVGPHGILSFYVTDAQGNRVSLRAKLQTAALTVTEVVVIRPPEGQVRRIDLFNGNIGINPDGAIEIVDQYQARFVLDPHQGALIYRQPEEIA